MRMGRTKTSMWWVGADHQPSPKVKVKGYNLGMFRIARFAGLSGVSPKMLRDYDRLGIFRPVWVDASTGYRSYSPAQLPEIRRIVALRDLGVGLAEIQRIVSGGADLAAVLDDRRAALEAERREVDRRLAALDISVSSDGEGRRRRTSSFAMSSRRPWP